MIVAALLLALSGTGFDTGYWQPGGYEARVGSPYYYSVPVRSGWRGTTHDHWRRHAGCECGRRIHAGNRGYHGQSGGHVWHGGHFQHHRAWTTDPYTYHFGPGYYRRAEHGHYRFPYYSYRRPWYYPGQPVFNRDTNFAW